MIFYSSNEYPKKRKKKYDDDDRFASLLLSARPSHDVDKKFFKFHSHSFAVLHYSHTNLTYPCVMLIVTRTKCILIFLIFNRNSFFDNLIIILPFLSNLSPSIFYIHAHSYNISSTMKLFLFFLNIYLLQAIYYI